MSAENGKKLFMATCGHCHTIEEGGKNMFGPALWGVFGRSAGQAPGYQYSPQHKESGIVWDEKSLNKYIKNPAKMVPGTKKKIPGVKKHSEREDIIQFIKSTTNV
eukprot:TRINITY_DN31708_c0_g1_i1.p1 TRINITY_DN31708_c0_g1~~TRINITY_DN31708_c0_g1_i1.p1  ORF type:complete len:105 (+),score=24.20 TRINITY_DN31708_c0_g1_i1:53-367(+)